MLAFLMIVSIAACDKTPEEPAETTGAPETTAPETTTEAATTEEPTTDDGKLAAPEYNGVFKTGYARVAITPTEAQLPVEQFTKVNNDIYGTCVAVNDGDKTIIIVSVDQKSMSTATCTAIKQRITNTTGVPVDNIFISATHNHSITPFKGVWANQAFVKIATAAQQAIDDLADTEIYGGRENSSGMAFVRRYETATGILSSVVPADKSVRSVRKPDEEIQVIRFVRADNRFNLLFIGYPKHSVGRKYPVPVAA